MTRRVLCVLVCLVATVAVAQVPPPRLMGQVLHATKATPLADVRVEVESHRRVQALPSPTDAAGHFGCDLAALFEPRELQTPALTLSFSKPGFQKVVLVLPWPPHGAASPTQRTVHLRELGSTTRLSPQEKAALRKWVSARGQTVYWLPYTVSPSGLTSRMHPLNRHFPQHVKRAITHHLETLPGVPDISLQALPRKLQATDTELLMAYGQYLNGLEMISGQGSPAQDAVARAIMHVASQYRIIPWLEELGTNTIDIPDTVPTERLLSAQPLQPLHHFWGRSTLLALSLRAFLHGRRQRDRDQVLRARAYLIEELRDVGPGNDHLESALRGVLGLVDHTLALFDKPAGGTP